MIDKQISFWMSPEMLQEFNDAVLAAGATKSGILRNLLSSWLSEQRAKAKKARGPHDDQQDLHRPARISVQNSDGSIR